MMENSIIYQKKHTICYRKLKMNAKSNYLQISLGNQLND